MIDVNSLAKYLLLYSDAIMGAVAYQITSVSIVYLPVCSDADQNTMVFALLIRV